MSLSTCRDCNREVSTLARHCVHCGRPRPAGFQAGSLVGGIAVAVLALVLTGAMVCAARRACVRYAKINNCWKGECAPVPQPQAADKGTFIRTLEKDGSELIEVGPGLYRLKPPASTPPPSKERY